MRTALLLTALLAVAAAPAPAATKYPDAKTVLGSPTPKPGGKGRTLAVCRRGCRYRTIQSAVARARAGDTVRVAAGTYREAVKIAGPRKSHVRLVGNAAHPERVILDGGSKLQNGVFVNGADGVQIRGFKAQNYKANGFFVTNAIGYKLDHLIAQLTGAYGLYAFNSAGGEMTNSEAYYMNDAGFYIGQTPVQSRPRRSIVRNVVAYGSVIGFSGTNMRYVTITKSQFFNNAVGIVPNALSSEKYPPAEDNVITDNDIFWNNFNYYLGAPFKLRRTAVGDVPYPPGSGVILLGGRRNRVEGNRIFGNWAMGVLLIRGFSLKAADAAAGVLEGNQVTGNAFGLDGTDLNGRELTYDTNGTGNCFSGNTGVTTTLPADPAAFPACPFTGANAGSEDAFNQLIALGTNPDHEAIWIRHPHAPRPGLTPLEHWTP